LDEAKLDQKAGNKPIFFLVVSIILAWLGKTNITGLIFSIRERFWGLGLIIWWSLKKRSWSCNLVVLLYVTAQIISHLPECDQFIWEISRKYYLNSWKYSCAFKKVFTRNSGPNWKSKVVSAKNLQVKTKVITRNFGLNWRIQCPNNFRFTRNYPKCGGATALLSPTPMKGRVHCFSMQVLMNKCFLLNPEEKFRADPSLMFSRKTYSNSEKWRHRAKD